MEEKEMERYDYRYEMYEDVKQAVKDWLQSYPDRLDEVNGDLMELKDELYDDLWVYDSVTGNGSGSYTFNAFTAAQCLAGNYDLLQTVFEERGYNNIPINRIDPEHFDVTIRCYLLDSVLTDVLSEMIVEKDGE